ncbi:MAG TPA: beta-ketoacyl-[acyl-carrier-protein] synthase family protein, partial [Tepidisphaeraceae bacterium]
MKQSPIGIIGSALTTSLGTTREQTWQAIAQGKCGIAPPTEIESPLPLGADAGQAANLPADFAADLPREARYLKWTIEHALADAGLVKDLPERTGVMVGTTLHGVRAAGEFLRTQNATPLRHFLAGNTLELAIKDLDIKGFCATTCSACSSSLGAIALAVTLLQTGKLDLVIAGGYDVISEYAYGGFNSLRLVADGPLLPFSRNRRGMKLAEGYGIVVLQRIDEASAEKYQAIIGGFGESADAHHLTQPHPEGRGAKAAMTGALQAAGIGPDQIGMVAAHATATPDNDAGEYAALHSVFGEKLRDVPVVGFKSHLGHTLGGAGAVELILSACALREQLVPPCANVKKEDVEFANLNVNTAPHPAAIQHTLNTSLGFGGANTCMILRNSKVRSLQTSEESAPIEVAITGIGVLIPGAIGNEAFTERMSQPIEMETLEAGAIPEEVFIHLLNARRIRRMSDYVKLSLAAAHLACTNAGVEQNAEFLRQCSVLLG